MSNLSELLPAGGGQNNFTFTADGAVSNGDPVVLNEDGTVSSVGTVSAALGTAVEIESETNLSSRTVTSTYDSTNEKVVITYIGTSNYGYAVVATILGSSVSYGTPVAWTSTSIERPSIAFGNGKVVVSYKDASGGTKARVGTVSGTSISFGNAETIDSNATAGDNSIAYHAAEDKFVVALQDNGSSSYGKASVGTVSGTTITFGSQTTFESAYTLLEGRGVVYDSTNEKIVIIYTDSANSNSGTGIVGTVSGTSISFGSAQTFGSGSSFSLSATFDVASGKVVVAGREGTNSYAAYVIGTVSGTSISFGTQTTFLSQSVANKYVQVEYDIGAEKVVFSTTDSTNDTVLRPGTVSGTSVTFDSPSTDVGTTKVVAAITYDNSAKKNHIVYGDSNNSNKMTGRTFAPSQSNIIANPFIGLAGQAISDAAQGTINVVGSLNEGQSGLTIGSDYYVQNDGTLSTTVSDTKVGKAISATKINMKNRS